MKKNRDLFRACALQEKNHWRQRESNRRPPVPWSSALDRSATTAPIAYFIFSSENKLKMNALSMSLNFSYGPTIYSSSFYALQIIIQILNAQCTKICFVLPVHSVM